MRIALIVLLAFTGLWYRQIGAVPYVFEDGQWLQAAAYTPVTWTWPSRDLSHLSYLVTWGSDPTMAHLGNLVLHAAAGVLVCALGVTLASPVAGLLAAGMFLWHPINSQAVSYLAARPDLLVTVFVLLAVLSALQGWWGVLAASLFAAGASKEIGVIAGPLVLVTLAVYRPQAITAIWGHIRGWWYAWAAVGVAAVFLAPKVWGWATLDPWAGGTPWPLGTFLVLQAAAVVRLVQLLIWPSGLSIDPDIVAVGQAVRVLSVLLLGVLLAVVPLAWKRAPVIAWALGWALVSFLPRFLFPTNEWIGEPDGYLAMAAVSVACGAGVVTLWRAWRIAPPEGQFV